MLSKILNNPSVQKAFLSQFEHMIEGEGLKAILINVDNTKEGKAKYEPVLFTEEVVVIKKTEYENMINALKSNL